MLSPRVPVQFSKTVVACLARHSWMSRAIAVGFLLLLVAPAPLFAQDYGVSATGYADASIPTTTCCVGFQQYINLPGGFLPAVTQSINLANLVPNTAFHVPLFGSASINWDATASLGKLHANIVTTSQWEGGVGTPGSSGNAQMLWKDTFTITSPTLAPGTPVSVRITAALDSSVSESVPCTGTPGPTNCRIVGDAIYGVVLSNNQPVLTLGNIVINSGVGPLPHQGFDQTLPAVPGGFAVVGQQIAFIANLQVAAESSANGILPSSSGSVDATAVFHFDVCTQGASYTTASGVSYSSGTGAISSCAPPCTSVLAPAVKLYTDPQSAQMRQPYELKAQVTNTDQNCEINFVLEWGEHYSFPKLNEPEQGGTTGSMRLAPGASVDLPLKTYTHTWQWLGPNPVGSLEDNLVGILEGLETDLSEGIVPAGTVLTTLVKIVSALDKASKFLPEAQTTTVTYTGRIFYGHVNPLEFSASVPSAQIQLITPLYKLAKLTAASVFLVAGDGSTSAGILLLLPNPPAGISLLLAQVAFLVDARIAYNQAADPPDPNFTEIAVPTALEFPELDALPQSFWKDFANSARAYEALDEAEAISNNRALGASIAGDAAWESAQVSAAAGFALDAGIRVPRLIGMLQVLQPFVEKNLQPNSQGLLTSLQDQGLPELEARYLTQLGWSPSDLTLLQQGLMTVGPHLVEKPQTTWTALKVASLVCAGTAIHLYESAVQIRVGTLGQSVTVISQDDLNSLDGLQSAIAGGLANGIPSPLLLEQIEDLISHVRRLLSASNNLIVLSPYLDFGLRALISFQQFDASIMGLQNFLDTLHTTGGILNSGIANSLQAKLNAAQQQIADGNFDSAYNILGALLNEVRAQRGKSVDQNSADGITGYATYLQSLLVPRNPQ